MSYQDSLYQLYEMIQSDENESNINLYRYQSRYSFPSISLNNYDQRGNLNHSVYLLNHISNLFSDAIYNLSNDIIRLYSDEKESLITISYKDIKDINKEKQCSICMEEYQDDSKVSKPDCLHLFHENCLKKWIEINKSCPICRCDI